ncbi:MAG: hypothetical protein ACR2GR_03920 [Rhodothermales bacterium]
MMSNREQLIQRLDQMPPETAEAVATVLLEKIDAQEQNCHLEAEQTTPSRADYQPFVVDKRVAGLGKGTVEMAPDFDASLPDSFWLGEE